MSQTVYQLRDYRIIETRDFDYDMINLKGDCFCPAYHPDIDPVALEKQERDFEQRVYAEGVYGYTLEKWNPAVGQGWQDVESCWGFVGRHTESNKHYIVEEFSNLIPKRKGVTL